MAPVIRWATDNRQSVSHATIKYRRSDSLGGQARTLTGIYFCLRWKQLLKRLRSNLFPTRILVVNMPCKQASNWQCCVPRVRGKSQVKLSQTDRVFARGRLSIYWCIYWLKVDISPVNRTGSPQGFSLDQVLHKLITIQNMHILQT